MYQANAQLYTKPVLNEVVQVPRTKTIYTCRRGAIFSSVLDTLNRIFGTGSDAIRRTSGSTSCVIRYSNNELL